MHNVWLKLKNIYILKRLFFDLSIHQTIMKTNAQFTKKIIKILFSTLKIIIDVYWAANHQISEGLHDTEDWSNDAENSAFDITGINYILKYIKRENCYFNM